MKILENGRKAWVFSALAFGLSVVSAFGGWYAGWRQNVAAAVLEQQMVNDNDAKLRGLIEEFQQASRVDLAQQVTIDSHDKSIRELTTLATRADERVSRLSDIVFLYVKTRMNDGEIPRR